VTDDAEFEQLLDYIRDNRGFDFTGYKRASLMRRVRRRMQDVNVASFHDYQDALEVHPEEFTHLFNTILINVTSFFRDDGAWAFMSGEVVPRIVERKDEHDVIRMWSVGCASGEEAYSLAMAIAEAVGLARLRERVKIYATDVDEEALAQARAGAYDTSTVATIPDDLREKYLDQIGDGRFAFRKDLRRSVIFGRHDLIQDAPISRVDLIACRNTLMYFNAEAQTKIYKNFHFALTPGGYLFLGKSEMLLTRTNFFQPVDLKRRVFRRVATPGEDEESRRAPFVGGGTADDAALEPLRAAVFESAGVAQLVVGADDRLVAANRLARSQLALGSGEIGRPFHELEVSYRPIELRSRIDRARQDGRANLERAVSWASRGGDDLFVDIEVIPIVFDGVQLGVSITFTDVTRQYRLQLELEQSRRELETAYEELQSTVEELETTNEELQSTNEELETTNEELQSTNEELETMNEELQSTNEELETINTELRDRTGELNQSNVFLAGVLGSLRSGVIVLDPEMRIESWNAVAENMWGLRADEVRGKNLFSLDFGMPVDRLRDVLRDASASEDSHEVTVDAVNRLGRGISCRVVASPLVDDDGGRHGLVLVLEPVE
jgi:two-component system CheB/CheR fusion protein